LFAFTKNWQKDSLKEGVMAVLIIGFFFAIGWALTGTLAFYIYPESWNMLYFTRDTFSLVILIIPEIIFFYKFFIKDKSI
jgi:hypothetical protein